MNQLLAHASQLLVANFATIADSTFLCWCVCLSARLTLDSLAKHCALMAPYSMEL